MMWGKREKKFGGLTLFVLFLFLGMQGSKGDVGEDILKCELEEEDCITHERLHIVVLGWFFFFFFFFFWFLVFWFFGFWFLVFVFWIHLLSLVKILCELRRRLYHL